MAGQIARNIGRLKPTNANPKRYLISVYSLLSYIEEQLKMIEQFMCTERVPRVGDETLTH